MRWLAPILLMTAAMPATAASRDWVAGHRQAIIDEYLPLLALPNVASNLEDIRRNAAHIMAMMERRGLAPRLLENADRSAPPLIYGEWQVPGAERTYVIYAHYDGQPVTPADWTVTPPFEPRIVGEGDNMRIFGRSASDDKAGVMAILAAVDALRAEGRSPSFNLKIVLEGEEEAGSPHLAELIGLHRETLRSDGWIIIDGPAHQSGPPLLALGVRGDVNLELTVHGPLRPLHSGHYGNWAPNPAMMLAELLASMKDESGRVTIAGFYDDVVPLTEAERAAIAAVPTPDRQLRQELGLGWTEGGGASLTELVALPSLNINGFRSADVGANSRNVIPTVATAALDLRLVLGNRPERQIERVIEHVRSQGYEVLDRVPTLEQRRRFPRIATIGHTLGYPAQRTPLNHPFAQSLTAALRQNGDFVTLPSMGGSLPLYLIEEGLNAPTVILGLWNHDNNQHAEDENIRLTNLFNGISTVAAVMRME
jgi:acetylornithine deacetylase/succinyl-diaminopimelate desuccinylase-like protein